MGRRLTKLERGEVFNLLYEYSRAQSGKRQVFIRMKLYDYIEDLLKEEVKK